MTDQSALQNQKRLKDINTMQQHIIEQYSKDRNSLETGEAQAISELSTIKSIYIYIHIHVHARTHIHIYVHTYTYTYTNNLFIGQRKQVRF